VIRAPLAWRRDPRDMYAISVTVPRGATHLDIVLDSALATEELMLESGDYYRTISVAYFDGARYPHLTRIDARPDILAQVLKARSN
jgi:hypothetical protein